MEGGGGEEGGIAGGGRVMVMVGEVEGEVGAAIGAEVADGGAGEIFHV